MLKFASDYLGTSEEAVLEIRIVDIQMWVFDNRLCKRYSPSVFSFLKPDTFGYDKNKRGGDVSIKEKGEKEKESQEKRKEKITK